MVLARNASAVLATATMFYFGTGLHPVWWLVWFAPIPVLLVAMSMSGRMAFALGALAFLGGMLNFWTYMHGVIGIPIGIIASIFLIPSVAFGLSVILWRALVRRGLCWLAALAMPVVWVSYEFISSSTSPHSTFGSIAYSEIDFLPVVQVAAVTGLAGITFLLMLVPAAIATRQRMPVAGALAILALVLAWGGFRLSRTPASPSIQVGLASSDDGPNIFPSKGPAIQRAAEQYASEVRRLAGAGAQLVVIPEKLAKAIGDDARLFDAPLAAAAAQSHVELAAGVERWTPAVKRNEVRMFAPTGEVEALYEKHHMLPPFESHLQVGTDRLTLQRPSGKWGVTICKDMDFPKLSREYGNDGVGLLIVPAWDFVMDGWLHDRMAVMRGVESGLTIVRAAKQGYLTVSDDRGRVLAEQQTGASPFASLLAAAPVRHSATIYAAWGDWFAWLNLAALAALMAGEIIRVWRRRRLPASSPAPPTNPTARPPEPRP